MRRRAKYQWVRELLTDRSLSQRKIAKITKVSRATVAAIARGKRVDYDQPDSVDDDDSLPRGPTSHCPECGVKVVMPCRACHVRALMAMDAPRPAQEPDPDEDLALDLPKEARARYEKIRFRPDSPAPKHVPNHTGRPAKHSR